MATVAINNAMNAGLLAIRILGSGNPALLTKMDRFLRRQEEEVIGKVEVLKDVGWERYEVNRP